MNLLRGTKLFKQLMKRVRHDEKSMPESKSRQPSTAQRTDELNKAMTSRATRSDHGLAKQPSSRSSKPRTGSWARPIVGIIMAPQALRKVKVLPPNSEINIYVDAAEQLGFTACAFSLRSVRLRSRNVNALVRIKRRWLKRIMPWPDIYYEQFWYTPVGKSKIALRLLRRSSTPLNSRNSLGKWLCHDVLRRYPDTAELLPETILFHELLDLSTMLEKYPVVFTKPDMGSGGRGISVVKRRGVNCYDWLDPASTKSFENLSIDQVLSLVLANCNNRPFVIQQELPLYTRDGRRGDIRTTFIKDDHGQWRPTIASGVRLAQPGKLITNYCLGSEWLPLPDGLAAFIGDRPDTVAVMKRINDTALLILKRLEEALGPMGEIGLDLALDQELRLWLLEANAKPSKEIYDYKPGDPIRDKHLRIMEYAHYLWKKRQKDKTHRP